MQQQRKKRKITKRIHSITLSKEINESMEKQKHETNIKIDASIFSAERKEKKRLKNVMDTNLCISYTTLRRMMVAKHLSASVRIHA